MLISGFNNYNTSYKPAARSEKSAAKETAPAEPKSVPVKKGSMTIEEFDRQYDSMAQEWRRTAKKEAEANRELRQKRQKKLLKAHIKKLQVKRETYEKAVIHETGERRFVARKKNDDMIREKTVANTADKDPVLVANAVAAYKASMSYKSGEISELVK